MTVCQFRAREDQVHEERNRRKTKKMVMGGINDDEKMQNIKTEMQLIVLKTK